MTSEHIWYEYRNQIRGFIRTKINDQDTVEDILQTVFMKIHKELSNFKPVGKLKSWLFQITRNTIIDYYRTQKMGEDIPEDITDTVSENSVVNDIANSIKYFILKLEEPYKKAMILSEIKGLSQKQVAEMMDISYSGAKSRIQRGREKVKEMMYECCNYEFDKKGNVIDYNCRKC